MEYRSNGKLMITGEYLALDNALVFALPTKKGQSLEVVSKIGSGIISWNSFTNEHENWFYLKIIIKTFEILETSDSKIANTLIKVLKSANNLSSSQLQNDLDYTIETKLEFPQNWGLGSSSTLINNIALWFNIDAFMLHFSVFNGSGYDVACGSATKGICYQINNRKPIVKPIEFNPLFSDSIYFVYLNQKQNSYNEIKNYKKNLNESEIKKAVEEISKISEKIIAVESLESFEGLLNLHEEITATVLKRKTIKELLFSDYSKGIVKSLGAWGGDFVLVTGKYSDLEYFKTKGYNTIVSYADMIL